MEMQFYPPGNPPFVDSDELRRHALVRRADHRQPGVHRRLRELSTPTVRSRSTSPSSRGTACRPGRRRRRTSDLGTFMPNSETLLMNPGDKITVHMFDAPAPGGGDAFKVVINDLTTHRAASCRPRPPTASRTPRWPTARARRSTSSRSTTRPRPANIIPWAALQTNISTEFETGHWEPCTSLSDPISPNPVDPADTGGTLQRVQRPVRERRPAGQHDRRRPVTRSATTPAIPIPGYDGPGTSTPPDVITGCQDNIFQNGDLDFDGSPYWTEWPTGTRPTIYPSTFRGTVPDHERPAVLAVLLPDRHRAERVDVHGDSATPHPERLHRAAAGAGRVLPVLEPSRSVGGICALEFGNVSAGLGVTDFGKDAQYGTNQFTTLGYPEFIGPVPQQPLPCPTGDGRAGLTGPPASRPGDPFAVRLHTACGKLNRRCGS